MNQHFKNEDEHFFKGKIWHFAAVREFLKEVVEKEGRIVTFKLGDRGVRVMSEFRDVHSELHEDIGSDVLSSLVLSIFDEKKITKFDKLYWLNGAFLIGFGSQTGTRGEDARDLLIGGMFLRHRDSIGPKFFSTPVSGKVMNGGKMNQQHRLNVTATINHQNPIMDAVAWEGAIIVYRMAVMNEYLDLTDIEMLLTRFLCRSHSSTKRNMSYQTHLKLLNDVFRQAGINGTKWVTHQFRGQVRRALYQMGVSMDVIQQFGNILKNVLTMSYLSGPPDEVLVKLAGGNRGEIGSFLPIRIQALYSAFRTEEDRNNIVYAILPNFEKVHFDIYIYVHEFFQYFNYQILSYLH